MPELLSQGEKIRAAVGDGAAFGLAVDYSFDGERLLGTGGALKRAASKLGEVFFVLYGDSYLCCSFADVEAAFWAASKPALMTILKNDGQRYTNNALYRHSMLHYDKRNPMPEMEHIDYGLSVVRADVLSRYGDDATFDLADVFADLSRQDDLAGFEVRDRFYEIGSHAGLREAEDFLSRKVK